MTRVRTTSSTDVFDAPYGEDLLEVLQSHGVPIATSCGGVASCGLCRVTVVQGKESISPITPQEILHLGNVAKLLGLRLACQSKICGSGEIVVDVPVVGDVEGRKRRKAERARQGRPGGPEERRAGRPQQGAAGDIIEWKPRPPKPPDESGSKIPK